MYIRHVNGAANHVIGCLNMSPAFAICFKCFYKALCCVIEISSARITALIMISVMIQAILVQFIIFAVGSLLLMMIIMLICEHDCD